MIILLLPYLNPPRAEMEVSVKSKILSLVLVLLLLTGFTGCNTFSKPETDAPDETAESEAQEDGEYPVSLNGASLEFRPGIIVSLSPAITEKLGDLGLQNRLEGITDYCDAPEGFQRARVGTAQRPDLDELEKLSPHLVLTEVELTEAETSVVAAMGAQIAVIPRAADIGGVLKNYMTLAVLLEGQRTGAALGDAFEKRFMQRYGSIVENGLTEPKNAVYLRELDFTVATGDTLEGWLMDQMGLNNIAEDYTDWSYSTEDAESEKGKENFASIDFIFCDKRTVTIKMLENSSFYKGLNAVRKDYYLYIDSTAFERQTMRMLDELDRMRLYVLGEIPGSKDEIEPEVEVA